MFHGLQLVQGHTLGIHFWGPLWSTHFRWSSYHSLTMDDRKGCQGVHDLGAFKLDHMESTKPIFVK